MTYTAVVHRSRSFIAINSVVGIVHGVLEHDIRETLCYRSLRRPPRLIRHLDCCNLGRGKRSWGQLH